MSQRQAGRPPSPRRVRFPAPRWGDSKRAGSPLKRAALLYSHEPSGHSAAARALEAALAEPGRWEAVRLNLSQDLHPILGPVVSRAYLELVQRTPRLWEILYDNQRLARATREMREFVQLLNGLRLASRLKALKPDVVACTHALPCGGLCAIKRRGGFRAPLAAVLTDFAAHGYWLLPEVDLYLVPAEETRSELERRGVAPERIKVTGLPIHPRFAQLPAKENARRRLRLPAGPVVLVTGGSKGLGPISEMVETLARSLPKARLLVSCGTNRELLQRLRKRRGEGSDLRLFGFHEGMADLLAASDLAVGKAGGLTLAESLAAGVPFLVFEPIPGQERRNARFVLKAGAAAEAESLAELARMASHLLRHPSELSLMSERARSLGRPRAAQAAAQALRDLAAAAKASP